MKCCIIFDATYYVSVKALFYDIVCSNGFALSKHFSNVSATGGSGGRRYSSHCAAASGGHSSLGSNASGVGGAIR